MPRTPVPYRTSTPTLTPTQPTPVSSLILPTSTPMTYTVMEGDTLSAIAGRYGITLEALLAANPGILPNALTVGTKLIIPAGEAGTAQPLPTAAPLPVKQARCWPEATGGLWCFALVQNDFAETIENISAQFSLMDAGGQEIASQAAYGLLDILPGGKSMPLAIHFAPPIQIPAEVRVQVLTAIRLLPGDTRYLPVLLENSLVSVEASGRSAQVSGKVVLSGEGSAKTLWVLATAYDAGGNVVGVRRWESTALLTAEAPASFDFLVGSVGAGIERVEFLEEARP
jgi:LysM repeat protein